MNNDRKVVDGVNMKKTLASQLSETTFWRRLYWINGLVQQGRVPDVGQEESKMSHKFLLLTNM